MTKSDVINEIRNLRNKATSGEYSILDMTALLGSLLGVLRYNDIFPDWIPITKKEPNDKEKVLVITDMFPGGYVTTAIYEDGKFTTLDAFGDAIAWMPFPSPYRG